jgi:hypothetical protein
MYVCMYVCIYVCMCAENLRNRNCATKKYLCDPGPRVSLDGSVHVPASVCGNERVGRGTAQQPRVLHQVDPLLLCAALLWEREALRHCLCRLLPSLQVPGLRAAILIAGIPPTWGMRSIFTATGHDVLACKLDCRDGAAAQGNDKVGPSVYDQSCRKPKLQENGTSNIPVSRMMVSTRTSMPSG